MHKTRYIAHVDMDAFFAAIEQRDDPRLKGKPVVVGSDPKRGKGRGVVSTCSYEARRFGIHSAMPISEAYRRCPQAVFLPVDMEKYSLVSREIYDILYSFTPDIEPISIDEAFLDITGSYHLFGSSDGGRGRVRGTPLEVCRLIKSRIKDMTRLTASVGLAPTKMAAKIASDLKKPDGLVEVTEEGLIGFLRPLDIRRLWGLGAKSEKVLRNIGINTIGDIADQKVETMMSLFGKNGEGLWQLANGIDGRSVETESEAKSVSNETTFEKDTLDTDKIEGALAALSERVSDRLRLDGIKGRTITLKVRLEGFDTYTRSSTIGDSTNFSDVIYKEIKCLFQKFRTPERDGKKIRLVGVRVSNLVPSGIKDSLFSGSGEEKKENMYKAIDRIKERFGCSALYRAGSRNG